MAGVLVFPALIVSLPGMGLNGEKPNRGQQWWCLTIAGSLRRLAVMLAPLLAEGGAYAQDAPPVEAGAPAGAFPGRRGGSTIVARTLGDELAGAGASPSSSRTARAPAGTIAAAAAPRRRPTAIRSCWSPAATPSLAHLYPRLSYDPLRDLHAALARRLLAQHDAGACRLGARHRSPTCWRSRARRRGGCPTAMRATHLAASSPASS